LNGNVGFGQNRASVGLRSYFRFGSNSDLDRLVGHVRSTPNSDH
jgi:hypothetical protein